MSDLYVEINLRPPEVNLTSLFPWDIMSALTWWQWLLVLKGALILWVLTVTLFLPSLYMQVMLYTDEMTSRQATTSASLVREVRSQIYHALAAYSALQQTEARQNWATSQRRYEAGRRRRRKKKHGRERREEDPTWRPASCQQEEQHTPSRSFK